MATSELKEWQFVSPHEHLKCLICLDVASNPKQHEECGKLFCAGCIERNGKRPCPNCRSKNPKYFKDKRGEYIIWLMWNYTDQGVSRNILNLWPSEGLGVGEG